MMVDEEEPHYGFPIHDFDDQAPIKNINLATLPNFHGLSSEDPNTFTFELEVASKYMTTYLMLES
jgi:hypothetical protein